MAKGIRALLDTVMQALPQVGNLGLLFFLLFFIFAALGVEMFGRLGNHIRSTQILMRITIAPTIVFEKKPRSNKYSCIERSCNFCFEMVTLRNG